MDSGGVVSFDETNPMVQTSLFFFFFFKCLFPLSVPSVSFERLLFTEWLFLSLLVPPPRQLTLERQLNKSILIGWNHPEGAPPESGQIASYHVYVDGILRTTIRAADRCRALIEGVDSSKVCGRLFYKRNCRHESSSFVYCLCSRTG